jgi:hypothetical protein
MKITGSVVNIELESIRFENLKGVERKCQESLKDFSEGDKIIVISLGEFKNDGIELNDGIYFVKQGAAQDFLVRFLDTINPKIVKAEEIH